MPAEFPSCWREFAVKALADWKTVTWLAMARIVLDAGMCAAKSAERNTFRTVEPRTVTRDQGSFVLRVTI